MLINELKKANMEALKNKDTNSRAILSVLINKYMLLEINKREKGEEIVDADVISLIQKTKKELQDEKENFQKVGNKERVSLLEEQEKVLDKFLPKMLSEDEIRNIINGLPDKSIPAVMKYFKENYAGKCEMGKVSQIAKNL